MCVAAMAADASGTWTFAGGRGGGGGGGGGTPPQNSLVLVAKDGKVTGKITMPGRQGGEATTIEIQNATVKDDVVTFSVETAGREGAKVVRKYSGKIVGDTITGTSEGPGRDGAVQSREWIAKRSK